MGAHKLPNETGTATWEMPDPGDTNYIPHWKNGTCAISSTEAGTTRKIADPTKLGLQVMIVGRSITTSIVITADSSVDGSHTVMTFGDAAGEYIILVAALDSSGDLCWRVLLNSGVALS